jgi:hypothetical protein
MGVSRLASSSFWISGCSDDRLSIEVRDFASSSESQIGAHRREIESIAHNVALAVLAGKRHSTNSLRDCPIGGAGAAKG